MMRLELISEHVAGAHIAVRTARSMAVRATESHRRLGLPVSFVNEARAKQRVAEKARETWLNALAAHTLDHAHIWDDCPACNPEVKP